jgi:hypothetical protein
MLVSVTLIYGTVQVLTTGAVAFFVERFGFTLVEGRIPAQVALLLGINEGGNFDPS